MQAPPFLAALSRRSHLALAVALLAAVASCKRHASQAAIADEIPGRVAPPESVPAVPLPPLLAISPVDRGLREGSTLLLARVTGRTLAFVANEDTHAIHTVDVDAGRELARTDLAGRPAQLLIVGGSLVAALRDEAAVAWFGLAAPEQPLVRLAAVTTADEPIALAASPDGATVHAASGWGHALASIDVATRKTLRTIALGREPRALSASGDGARVFVGYLSESAIEAVDLASGARRPIALGMPEKPVVVRGPSFGKHQGFGKSMVAQSDDGEVTASFFLPARVGRQVFSLVRVDDSDTLLAPHLEVGAGDAQAKSGGYGANAEGPVLSMLARITSLSSQPHTEMSALAACGQARAAAHDPTTHTLAVACLGGQSVKFLDARTGAQKAALEQQGGPEAIASDPGRAWVLATGLRRFVRVLPLAKLAAHLDRGAPLPNPIELSIRDGVGLSPDALDGREIFHDALGSDVSRDGRSCSSCHPDGRDDGLVWPTSNGPRQTTFLAGRLDRGAPYGWDGVHESLETHIRSTVVNLLGFGLNEAALRKLTAYLRAMPPPPQSKRTPTEKEARGAHIFASSAAGCSGCHTEGPSLVFDVKSATKRDAAPTFLAPSLRFIGGTAPYFHDGRYASLEGLLRGSDGTMGSTSHLGDDDLAALAAYLRSL